MSDVTSRGVPGPPSRAPQSGSSGLIKALRKPATPVGTDETPAGAAPSRSVAPPPPRVGRTSAPSEQAVDVNVEEWSTPSVASTPPGPQSSAPVPPQPTAAAAAATSVPAAESEDDDPAKVTVKMPKSQRNRMRAAFRGTRDLEGEDYVTDMIVKAIMDEVERRERLYNDGQPFPGGERALPRGRAFQ